MTVGAATPAGDSAAALPILERWVEDFNRALESRSEAALAALFLDDSYWRDFAACTWDVRTVHGAGDIAAALLAVAELEKVQRVRPRARQDGSGGRTTAAVAAFA